MKTITGEDVVLAMMDIATDVSHWNRKHVTKTVIIRRLEELYLTQHQVEILGALYNNPEWNTVSVLSAELFISKSSLSLMLTKLERGGFIEKTAATGKDDGRKVYISLTAHGREAVESIKQLMVSNAAVAFEEMTPKTRALFYTKVKELQELFHVGGQSQ